MRLKAAVFLLAVVSAFGWGADARAQRTVVTGPIVGPTDMFSSQWLYVNGQFMGPLDMLHNAPVSSSANPTGTTTTVSGGSDTYTGTTDINEGLVGVGSGGSMTINPGFLDSGEIDGGSVTGTISVTSLPNSSLNFVSSGASFNNTLIISPLGGSSLNLGGLSRSTAGSASLTSPFVSVLSNPIINIPTSGTLLVPTGLNPLVLNGLPTFGTSLTKVGAGTLQLSGSTIFEGFDGFEGLDGGGTMNPISINSVADEPFTFSMVPEPASVVLAGCGLAALLFHWRRKSLAR